MNKPKAYGKAQSIHMLKGEGPFVSAAQLAYTQNNHTQTVFI